MAFAATMTWQVQATASDSNGGGFDPTSGTPGTDYSLQDSPQVTHTDAVIGTPNTTATSAANPYTSTHVGNVENWTSGTGWTVQRAQILSVAAGVATFDKALGTIGSTGGNGKLGGALASPGQAGALKVSGNSVYIKNSGGASPTSYLMTNSSNVSGGKVADNTGGISSAPGYWVGYETTRTVTNTDANRPRLLANANSVTCFASAAASAVFRNVDVGNNGAFTGVTGISLSGTTLRAERVVATGIATGFSGSGSTTKFVDCAAVSCTTGFNPGSSQVARFVASACGTGITFGTAGTAEDGLIVNCTTAGAVIGANAASLRHASLAGNAVGVSLSGSTGNSLIEDCVAWGSTGANYADSSAIPDNRVLDCFGGGGGSADTVAAAALVGFVTLTADPFANAAGGDYAPNSTAGGGALVRATTRAFLGLSTTTTRPDAGAVQSAASATYVFDIQG